MIRRIQSSMTSWFPAGTGGFRDEFGFSCFAIDSSSRAYLFICLDPEELVRSRPNDMYRARAAQLRARRWAITEETGSKLGTKLSSANVSSSWLPVPGVSSPCCCWSSRRARPPTPPKVK